MDSVQFNWYLDATVFCTLREEMDLKGGPVVTLPARSSCGSSETCTHLYGDPMAHRYGMYSSCIRTGNVGNPNPKAFRSAVILILVRRPSALDLTWRPAWSENAATSL